MAQSTTLCVGMEVHKDRIAVADVAQEPGADVPYLDTIGTRQDDIAPLGRTMPSQDPRLIFLYAAGPCGSGRSRSLPNTASHCWGVAPSLLPKKAGERVKTDRRDALQRTRLARAGALTPVSIPPGADAASRDLTRACAGQRPARRAGLRGARPTAGGWRKAWGPLRRHSSSCTPRAGPSRSPRSAAGGWTRHVVSRSHPGAGLPASPPAWRGGPCTVTRTRGAAMGDRTRCEPPRALRQFLGGGPAASSSGARRQHGAMTHTGPPQARRVRVAGAWASRSPANIGRPFHVRLANQLTSMQAIRCKPMFGGGLPPQSDAMTGPARSP
jgi:transposase